MDPVLLALAAVPFVFTALLLRTSYRSAPHAAAAEVEAWKRVALADDFERSDVAWVRRLNDGLEIELSGRPEKLDGDRVQARVLLTRPLSTELHVTPNDGSLPTDARVSRDFAARYRLKSPRPQRAERLLRRGGAWDMVNAHTAGWSVSADHREVRVVGRWITEEAQVRSLMAFATRIARRMLAADKALPELLPWPDVKQAWAHLAERLGARFDAEARSMELVLPSGVLTVRARTEREEHWFADATLALDRRIEDDFEVTSAGARSLWDKLSKRDLEVGDAEFDERFFVTSSEPDAGRGLLDAELRRALLELERLSSAVLLAPDRIEIVCEGGVVGDAFEAVLDATMRAAEAIAAHGRAGRGDAYR